MHLWEADSPDTRRTLVLDQLTAVYHRPSRSTHLLASPLPEILEALAAGPADVSTLRARLEQRHAVEGEAAALEARLEELAAIGLAWRR